MNHEGRNEVGNEVSLLWRHSMKSHTMKETSVVPSLTYPRLRTWEPVIALGLLIRGSYFLRPRFPQWVPKRDNQHNISNISTKINSFVLTLSEALRANIELL